MNYIVLVAQHFSVIVAITIVVVIYAFLTHQEEFKEELKSWRENK